MDGKSSGLVLCEKPYTGGVIPTKLTDRSRMGNDGVWTNVTAVQLPSGLWVNSFDGTAYISTCLPLFPVYYMNRELTIHWWAKRSDTGNTDYCFGFSTTNAGLSIVLTSGARLTAESSVNGNVTTSTIITSNTEWHSYDITIAGLNIYFCQDSVAVGSDTFPSVAGQYFAINRIGAGLSMYFTGQQAIHRIYNRALSPAEIRAIFTQERAFFGV